MVTSEKKKVVLCSKSRKNNEQERRREVETQLVDYGDARIPGTNVVISVAVATFDLKNEDRNTVLLLSNDEGFHACQKKLRCQPSMIGFVGVFDGHDGDLASDYCSKGLVPHIISEIAGQPAPAPLGRWNFTNDRAMAPLDFETKEQKNSFAKDMQGHYISAFQKAQDRFHNNLEPPSFDEVSQPGALKVAPPITFNPIRMMAAATSEIPRGGTTACTLSIFTSPGEDKPQVVVANTGDSRLITDDGTGTGIYWQVTTDHRPDDPAEKKRLTECAARGESYVQRSSESAETRVFPGGLAVSRTIGDGNCSKSVICTPEVLHVPLAISADRPEENAQRFVLATDGLWDTLDNDVVGQAAARKSGLMPSGSRDRPRRTRSRDGPTITTPNPFKRSGTTDGVQHSMPERKLKLSTPKEAAARLLQLCLDRGGARDDITICVVDVSYL